jgi:hypothetical protein
MLSIFTRKKITDETLANIFVNGVLKLAQEGFKDLSELINNDLDLIGSPSIKSEDFDKFALIVFTANVNTFSDYFNALEQMRMQDLIYSKLSMALNMSKSDLKTQKNKISELFNSLNHPSKNVKYAMSKTIFHLYDLYGYQDEYFKNLKVANPVALKKLNETMDHFIWDWDSILKRYKPVFK